MYSAALDISPWAWTVVRPVSITCVMPRSRGFACLSGRRRKSGIAGTLTPCCQRPAPGLRWTKDGLADLSCLLHGEPGGRALLHGLRSIACTTLPELRRRAPARGELLRGVRHRAHRPGGAPAGGTSSPARRGAPRGAA